MYYEDVVNEIDVLLLRRKIHRDLSDIFTRLLLGKVFKLDTSSVTDPLPVELTFKPCPGNRELFVFHFRAHREDRIKFREFLQKHVDPEVEERQGSHDFIVRAHYVSTALIPLLKIQLEELEKHFPHTVKEHVRKSMDHPYFVRDSYERDQLMDQPDNPYGLMMREIKTNLNKILLSDSHTNIISNVLIHLAGKHKSSPAGKKYNRCPIDYFPAKNGNEIVFQFYNHDEEFTAFMKRQPCRIKVKRTPPNHVTITMKTRDFYQHIMPMVRESIKKMADNPASYRYNEFKKLSAEDIDVKCQSIYNEEHKSHLLPVQFAWEQAVINFPVEPQHRPNFFIRAAHAIKEVACDVPCCKGPG